MNLILLHISIISLFLNIHQCDGYIKCFSCESINDNRCGDYFQLQTFHALDCQGTCIKRRGRRSGSGVEITRACVIQTGDGCHDTTYDGMSVTACTCNTDYCNLATDVHGKKSFIILTVISTFLIKYLL